MMKKYLCLTVIIMGCLVTCVYTDPNVRKTVEALRAMPEALRELSFTQADLDAYILNAYSTSTIPLGMLNDAMWDMRYYGLLGADAERVNAVRKAIKNASLEDRPAAVEHIAAVLENSSLCMAGNEALIRADADCFDRVISYRHADAEADIES